MSLTEAARRLSELGDQVDRSTLSRYVRSHVDALNPSRHGRETIVDFTKLREHRKQNIRLDHRPFAPVRSRADSQTRKIDADAQLRELELARQLDKLTLVDEVAEAAHSAIAAMRTAFDLAVNDTAEQLAHRLGSEPRLVRPLLRGMISKAMDAFSRAMSEYVDALETPSSPETPSA